MDLIYNNTWTVYAYGRDLTSKISDYSDKWTEIDIQIQPLWTNDWFDSSRVYKTSRIYTKSEMNVWDKIVIDNIAYIVDTKEKRDSPEITYFKYIVSESEWT